MGSIWLPFWLKFQSGFVYRRTDSVFKKREDVIAGEIENRKGAVHKLLTSSRNLQSLAPKFSNNDI